MTSTDTPAGLLGDRTTQIYRVYIRATPEAIWDAITGPDWTERYGYGGRVEFDLRPGGAFRSIAGAEMQAAGAAGGHPRRRGDRVRSAATSGAAWRAGWDAEPATGLTYVIAPGNNGVSSLTLTHELADAPRTAAMVGGSVSGAGGGWSEVLSDLKSLLETGRSLYGGQG